MKLQLYYPHKPLQFNQYFGQIDPKYIGLGMIGHNGIDFGARHGDPVYAAHDGVASYQVDGSAGHGVVIRTNEPFDYNGGTAYMKTIYWHLCDSAKEPQYKSPVEGVTELSVKVGDIIGYADNTGLSTGDHLHFGLKAMLQGEPDGTWYNLQQNNGYFGAIDPLPYFNNYFAQDITQIISLQTKVVEVLQKLISILKK